MTKSWPVRLRCSESEWLLGESWPRGAHHQLVWLPVEQSSDAARGVSRQWVSRDDVEEHVINWFDYQWNSRQTLHEESVVSEWVVMTWKNTSSTGLTTSGTVVRRCTKSQSSVSCQKSSRRRSLWTCIWTHLRESPYSRWLYFFAAAEYPDPSNFCCCRKSAGKIAAAVNAAEFIKFGQPLQKFRL